MCKQIYLVVLLGLVWEAAFRALRYTPWRRFAGSRFAKAGIPVAAAGVCALVICLLRDIWQQ
jgi:hypothetical protein